MMTEEDTYRTLKQPSTGEFRERGSKFLAFAYPVEDERSFRQALEEIKGRYADASHHCYAYIFSPGNPVSKSNDAGEPANTAGKPILRQILSKELMNTGIIVVRYFGGKLLGVPGLINAYGNAALSAIENAGIITKVIENEYVLEVDYKFQNEAFRFLKIQQAGILLQLQEEKLRLVFSVRRSKASQMLNSSHDFHNFTVKLKA
jgi:uncharacterized YigZ family protein